MSFERRHRHFRLAAGHKIGPERSDDRAVAARGAPQQDANPPSRSGRVDLRRDAAGQHGFVVDTVIPLDPDERRRQAQQVEAARESLPVGERELGAGPRHVVGEHETMRARDD